MALPPFEAGAAKVTVALPLSGTAVTPVGAPGTVAWGVTLLDAEEAALVARAVVAVTVNVYAVPLVRPVMIWLVAVVPALLSTPPAGVEVTV